MRQCWLEDWESYHRRVVAEIPADELLVFDIESDPPERLCDFIGVPRDVGLAPRHPQVVQRGGGVVWQRAFALRRALGWSAARDDLDVIVASALAAERVERGRAGAATPREAQPISAEARLQ